MQASFRYWQLALVSFFCIGCNKTPAPQSFEAAIAKHRHTLVDQVNIPDSSTPYYTVETLNPVWKVTDQTPIVSIPHFKLLDQDGKNRDESLFSGKITVVGFIFAACNGFCPFLVEGMKAIESDIAKNAKKDADISKSDIQFVAFSVNPEEDTPEVLREYAEDHNLNTRKNWTLLTGDKATIMGLVKKTFASQAFKRPTAETNYVHSEHLYVIDQAGKLRGILNGTRVDIKDGAHAVIGPLARR